MVSTLLGVSFADDVYRAADGRNRAEEGSGERRYGVANGASLVTRVKSQMAQASRLSKPGHGVNTSE
jgi:hypothetical protein